MLRIVYTPTEIVTIIANDPTMGTTYSPFNVLVCTSDEALAFFNGYAEEEMQKLIDFIETPTNSGTTETVIL